LNETLDREIEAGSTSIPYSFEMDEIWQRGAVGIAGLIRQGKVSSVEVVEAFLQRIEEVNPIINAGSVAGAGHRSDRAGGASYEPDLRTE
jgi:hypothetical protein